MDLPEKEYYTLAEMAEYFSKDEDYVKHQIRLGRLQPSVFLCSCGTKRWVSFEDGSLEGGKLSQINHHSCMYELPAGTYYLEKHDAKSIAAGFTKSLQDVYFDIDHKENVALGEFYETSDNIIKKEFNDNILDLVITPEARDIFIKEYSKKETPKEKIERLEGEIEYLKYKVESLAK